MATNWSSIKVGRNDRAVIIGPTECGKTTLARYLLEDDNKRYSVVYDAKISDSISKWTTHKFYGNFGEIQDAEERRLIYRPPYTEEKDPAAQDAFFQWVYFRYRTRLYVDEAYALLGGPRPSFHLQACITRGRERGISTIVSTQRPRNIPLITLSEAEHYYIFSLRNPKDKEYIEQITGISKDAQDSLKRYHFWYYNVYNGIYPIPLTLQLDNKRLDNGRTEATHSVSIQRKTA